MKMFEHPKREFFTSTARLNFEVYGQNDKITPEGEKKGLLFGSLPRLYPEILTIVQMYK